MAHRLEGRASQAFRLCVPSAPPAVGVRGGGRPRPVARSRQRTWMDGVASGCAGSPVHTGAGTAVDAAAAPRSREFGVGRRRASGIGHRPECVGRTHGAALDRGPVTAIAGAVACEPRPASRHAEG